MNYIFFVLCSFHLNFKPIMRVRWPIGYTISRVAHQLWPGLYKKNVMMNLNVVWPPAVAR